MKVPLRLMLLILPGVVMLLAWEMLTAGSSRRQFLFASPSSVLRAGAVDLMTSSLWRDVGLTGSTAVMGLVVGWVSGSALGLTLWSVPWASRIARPYLIALSAVPVFALAPVLIVWFGVGLTPKVVMAGFPVWLTCTLSSYWSAVATDRLHAEWMHGLGLSRLSRIRQVIVPETIGKLMQDLRLCVGAALVGTFIGEFIVSQAGLGRYILKAGGLYDMPRVFLGIGLMVALSGALIGLAELVARRSVQRQED